MYLRNSSSVRSQYLYIWYDYIVSQTSGLFRIRIPKPNYQHWSLPLNKQGKTAKPNKTLNRKCFPIGNFRDGEVLESCSLTILRSLSWVKTLNIITIYARSPLAIWCDRWIQWLAQRSGQVVQNPHLPVCLYSCGTDMYDFAPAISFPDRALSVRILCLVQKTDCSFDCS